MSKGFGKWQRIILDALETSDPVILRDLLPPDYKHADLSALYRAAKQLERAGRVRSVLAQKTWRKHYLAVTREPYEVALKRFKAKFGGAP